MKGSFMKRLEHLPTWTILGVGLLVIAGLLVAAALFNPGAASTAPERTAMQSAIATENPTVASADTAAPESGATSEPKPTSKDNATEEPDAASDSEPTPGTGPMPEGIAATVNGYTITQAYLNQTVRLNTVLGELSGAPTLNERETLQRLIRSQLILQGVTTIDEPTEEDVRSFIGALQSNWNVSQETVDQKLQAVDLGRAFLEDTISRLLTVQAGVDSLEEEGYNVTEWLKEQEEDAKIMVFEDLASEEETEATPPEVPDVAPSFTLDKAGGGSFALEDQLKEGPVVLVFFEKCG